MKHYVRKFIRKVTRHAERSAVAIVHDTDPFGAAMGRAFHAGRRTK